MEGIDFVKKSLEYKPENIWLREHLARTLELLNNKKEAKQEYQTLLKFHEEEGNVGLASRIKSRLKLL